ncbi:MAG TPA: DNA mismatch repair protein MutS [Candidatus Krumholzibacteria bacterium]|nr:DNA mismatch repair protein MutS [Candidatus Krumholzibacteria bacterium]HPD71563.1 DNA mismatch repair protein MutS [Candidatus Krumholzibacteria bacterium]HRY41504.1 DNA mismatch repair protein MutS [Candidatus Krumholzibacteria bacterium]
MARRRPSDAAATSAGADQRLTPMLAQYLEIKSRHPGAILLYRMGDFFETFFEDAEILARTAGVTLTSRDKDSAHPVPLAGVPHHALATYLARLLDAGLTVAICEQVEDPATAKGLVKREVVEILSPGTATAAELIASASGHYCLAYLPPEEAGAGAEAGWALLDATTGEFRCGQEPIDLAALCERHAVREVILRESLPESRLRGWRAGLPAVVLNPVSDTWFHPALAQRTLLDHFQVASLGVFGLDQGDRQRALSAAGALLRYLTSLNLRRPAQVTSLRFAARGDRLLLDAETLRNLEIFRTFTGDRGPGTLVHHVDRTVTAAGRRLLEDRLAEPLVDRAALARWHAGVAALRGAGDWCRDLRAVLRGVGDLERLAARAATGRIGPRQLRQLGLALEATGELRRMALAGGRAAHPVCEWARELPELAPLGAELLRALPDEPPAHTRQGGYLRDGVSEELDRCRALARDTKGFLAGLQLRERERTGITTLKVGYNKVFGYYFDVTRKNLDKVPPDYEQTQTLVNSSRFVTCQLKEAEATILEAEERGDRLEAELFAQLVASVGARLADISVAANRVAQIDLMTAFAVLAEERRYCQPTCDESCELEIREGRHPVVEQLLADQQFIPNDTVLDDRDHQLILLTGPNMGGKSTYLRQTALIVLLAQSGSHVPAASARIGWIDRIFTRVGASDNLARGESTFYTEMSETAHILHQMSRRSLVILDEIGRGTSTYDGLSLAWAITEFLHDARGPRPRSIFATHYHELTELAATLPGLVNLQLQVREWEGKIIFLHHVAPGRSDKSYGIHVARLAGVPETVLRRAESLLAYLTREDARSTGAGIGLAAAIGSLAADAPAAGGAAPARQLSLFRDHERDALDALRELDIETISPVEAFMWLVRIKRQLSGENPD